MSSSSFSVASRRSITALVSWMLLFCGRLRSTSSSGRSEDGKNWCWTNFIRNSDTPNSSAVRKMVVQRRRIARCSRLSKRSAMRPFFCSDLCLRVFGRMCTAITGANSTATIHDSSRATAITANRVKVYSPAELALSPMGTKPATVTRVPVSIGKAVEV
ncbi:Uncharacterised protein [Acinetobacter baumannii]|nr:Uncharacterised protein [Acinetobacter baumannii]